MTIECKYKSVDKEKYKFQGKPYCTCFCKLCEDLPLCDDNCQIFEDYKELQKLKEENRRLWVCVNGYSLNDIVQITATKQDEMMHRKTLKQIEDTLNNYGNNGILLSVEKQEEILSLIKSSLT